MDYQVFSETQMSDYWDHYAAIGALEALDELLISDTENAASWLAEWAVALGYRLDVADWEVAARSLRRAAEAQHRDLEDLVPHMLAERIYGLEGGDGEVSVPAQFGGAERRAREALTKERFAALMDRYDRTQNVASIMDDQILEAEFPQAIRFADQLLLTAPDPVAVAFVAAGPIEEQLCRDFDGYAAELLAFRPGAHWASALREVWLPPELHSKLTWLIEQVSAT